VLVWAGGPTVVQSGINMTDKTLVEVEAIFGRIESFRDDLITDQIVAFGAHTRPELAFLLSMVDGGDSLFDIGGHIGTFAIPLAQKIGPQGQILVVEGAPFNFKVLTSNFARVGPRSRVRLRNALIAPLSEVYAMQERDGNTGASYFMPAANQEPLQVSIVSLDALCESEFIPRVVKIDIEGFEAFALAHAPRFLSHRPIIYSEVADELLRRHNSSLSELDGILRNGGYRLFKNDGDRNAAHDQFYPKELTELSEGGDFFDVLAVHKGDPRLDRLVSASVA
jgi:FkbM family methyltransferase